MLEKVKLATPKPMDRQAAEASACNSWSVMTYSPPPNVGQTVAAASPKSATAFVVEITLASNPKITALNITVTSILRDLF